MFDLSYHVSSDWMMALMNSIKAFLKGLNQALVPKYVRSVLSIYLAWIRGLLMNRLFGLRDQVRSTRFFSHSTVDVDVVTIDGVSLRTTTYHPHHDESETIKKGPCVIFRTPYYRFFDTILAIPLAERGYHVLIQDVRGRFDSTGKFTMGENEKRDARCTLNWLAHQPWHDGRVAFAGISIGGFSTWCSVAGALEFLNSKDGVLPNEGGEPAHKLEIVGIFPFCSSSDIIRCGLLNEGGGNPDAAMKLDIATKYSDFMHHLQKSGHVFGSKILYVMFRAAHMAYKFKTVKYKEAQKHLPLQDVDRAVIGEEPLVKFTLQTDPQDAFWRDINQTWAVKWVGDPSGKLCPNPLTPPHLHLVSGWYDVFSNETINDYLVAYNASEAAKKAGRNGNDNIFLTIGPWTHFDTYYFLCMREAVASLESQTESLHHSEHDKNDPGVPRCMIYCLNAGKRWRHRLSILEKLEAEMRPSTSVNSSTSIYNPNWRFYSEFPPKSAIDTSLKLLVGKTMNLSSYNGFSTNPENETHSYETLRFDPNNPTPTLGGPIFDMVDAGPKIQYEIERRSDVLVFTSPPLRYPFEIAGKVILKVRVSSSALSCDVHGTLCVYEDGTNGSRGESIGLTQGLKRVTPHYENNGNAKFPMDVDVNLGYTCARFEAGQRIRLQIAGGSFPLYSRNLGFGEPSVSATKMQPQVNTFDLKYCSLVLPVSLGKVIFRQ